MEQEKLNSWIMEPKNNEILISFTKPNTQAQITKKHSVSRHYLKQFLKYRLIKCLSPNSYKGKLYGLTNKAKKLLGIKVFDDGNNCDYDLIGWVLASPKQRLVVLNTLSLNSIKQTSEKIRLKSKSKNPCLSRISTKNILKELIDKGLVETELGSDRRRYYWTTEKGRSLISKFN